ncbi:YdeI/OmpD-associated family protein [Nocardia wallacei]|uniref:YdeI/OmpD-associated family protein n=1 Tax=Nocardia wallacei TaxID=480035 RepID=UPI0024543ABD|nr:YdeI/OmpD-associated family protein [Nocardia wallacei]
MQRFEAGIEAARGGGAYVPVPGEVVAALGGGGRIPVLATFDGVEYRGSIVSMGDGPCIGLVKNIRTALGKRPGDTVTVTVARDTAERTAAVPDELAAALAAGGLRDRFDRLSYSRRREYADWVSSAKRAETRTRRIEKIVDSLCE